MFFRRKRKYFTCGPQLFFFFFVIAFWMVIRSKPNICTDNMPIKHRIPLTWGNYFFAEFSSGDFVWILRIKRLKRNEWNCLKDGKNHLRAVRWIGTCREQETKRISIVIFKIVYAEKYNQDRWFSRCNRCNCLGHLWPPETRFHACFSFRSWHSCSANTEMPSMLMRFFLWKKVHGMQWIEAPSCRVRRETRASERNARRRDSEGRGGFIVLKRSSKRWAKKEREQRKDKQQ